VGESDRVAIVPAGVADAGELLTLQRAAYVTEALLYGTFDLPPLTQTLDGLRAELAESYCLKAVVGERVVGSVRCLIEGGTGRVGRLMVSPDLRRRGIATRLMAELEVCLAGRVERLELFTGDRSDANRRLYRRLGYLEFERPSGGECGAVGVVFMEKVLPRR
jgi:ribosomal protein S18 acetylase RimI-like enzyme